MVFHGLPADEQLGRGLGIGQSLTDEVGHLRFPGGQRQDGLFLGRFGVYSKLEMQLQEDLPYIALYQQDYTIALSKGFTVPHFNELRFMFDDYALQIKRAQ